jgi:hypothetical protein
VLRAYFEKKGTSAARSVSSQERVAAAEP